MAYKSYQPQNNKIIVVNMLYDHMFDELDLGEWEFFCFVGHTQMVDQKIFREKFERCCHIMMIIRCGLKYRLIDIQYNPFLALDENGERVIKLKKDALNTNEEELKRLKKGFAWPKQLFVCNTEFSIGYDNRIDSNYQILDAKQFNSDKL